VCWFGLVFRRVLFLFVFFFFFGSCVKLERVGR